MGKKLRQFGLRSKALLFTVVIHGALIAFLFHSFNFNWSGTVKPGGAGPIEARVVSARDFDAQQAARQAEQKKKAEQEKGKLVAEEKREAEQEKKKQEVEEKKKKQEAEKKRKAEQLKKKQEAEKKRKAEQLKKKQEAEAKRQRAEQLRKRLEQEQRAKNKKDAGTAFRALEYRIKAVVENNWRRPHTSQSGLTATIRVKVARGGRVLSARVIRTSGDPDFDHSARIAVLKASPLPFPSEPHYYEFINEFNLEFAPDE